MVISECEAIANFMVYVLIDHNYISVCEDTNRGDGVIREARNLKSRITKVKS